MSGLAWQDASGQVLGTYLHGLFEQADVLQALFGAKVPTLETVLDGLADYVAQHFEPGTLPNLLGPSG
jgi:adenosylcobyric acid synthase